MERKDDVTLEFQWMMAHCEICREITVVPWLCIDNDFITVGNCKKCGGEARVVYDNNTSCPYCDFHTLTEDVTGMWD